VTQIRADGHIPAVKNILRMRTEQGKNKMDSKTINTTFDPTALPKWAQNDPNVVALCERDLSFRVNVFEATTAQYKQTLKRQAERAARNGRGIM
jgi:hypothetical protein